MGRGRFFSSELSRRSRNLQKQQELGRFSTRAVGSCFLSFLCFTSPLPLLFSVLFPPLVWQHVKHISTAIKPGAMTDRDTFVMSVLELAESSGKEVAVAAALEEMIADIEMYGLPPCESGDPVRDMEEYRRYHGLDRVFGFLLQSLIMHEPNDPVQHMQERVNELSEFVRLRRDIGDQPYHGHEAIKKSA
uniref:Uncharacterized protein n=1 Tax=Guillardia theta TaxID=55529 RepID=A0A7S4L691_GUITH